jgi:AmiR/NasT family two-component response regulator
VPKRDLRPVLTPVDGDGRLEFLERENAQLREALASRIVIEQAKGVLAERFGLDLDEAFTLLRSAARSNRMPIHTLAAAVTAAARTPPEIQALLVRVPSNGASAVPLELEETS